MEKIAKSELRKAKGKSEVAPEQIPTIATNAAAMRNPGRACRAGVCSCGDGAPAIGAVGGEYGLESNLFTVGRTTEGFYDTAFSPKPISVATQNSLPKRNHVAKEAVSAAWQTKTRKRSERACKPNDAPKTKPRPCVKTMLCAPLRHGKVPILGKISPA